MGLYFYSLYFLNLEKNSETIRIPLSYSLPDFIREKKQGHIGILPYTDYYQGYLLRSVKQGKPGEKQHKYAFTNTERDRKEILEN